MRVVIVGPGRIGCGFLTPMFLDAGWDVVLAARTRETAAQIAAEGFTVLISGQSARPIGGVPAVVVGTPSFDLAVAGADLIVTAVGVSRVEGLGRPLARALARRGPTSPIDIWAVENQDVATTLEVEILRAAATARRVLPAIGVSGAVAGAAVSQGSWHGDGRPQFLGDAARWLLVDEARLVRGIPNVAGVEGTRQYAARLQEKLFVFNAGHALAAYLGALRGHATVDLAVHDPFLRPLIAGCLLEARGAVLQAHPLLGGDVHGPVAEALRRFGDHELADPMTRVARDPIRKLSPGNRLLGPAELIRRMFGYTPPHFALGIAGALLYRGPQDSQAARLAGMLRCEGVAAVLERVCGLDPADELARGVASRYSAFILTDRGAIFPRVHEPSVPRPMAPLQAVG